MHDADEGAFGLSQLFVVAAPEAEGMLVGVRRTVKPACWILAGVGEVLRGCGTQQLQKGHLDHINRVSISVDVGKLNDREQTTGVTQMNKCATAERG